MADDLNLFQLACRRQLLGQRSRCAFQSSPSWIQRYELATLLKGHAGCVNTIQWSVDGRLLCSGSDDRFVHLWRLERTARVGVDSSPIVRVASLPTMHRHNIFDAQLTACQKRIVSCGADGRVCLTEIDAAGRHGRALLFEPQRWHVMSSKIAFFTHGGPDVFLVTFGDGYVRMFDLRESGHRVAIDASATTGSGGIGLTGIEMRPMHPNVIAIAGSDPYLRLYDLRTLKFDRESVDTESVQEAPTPALSSYTSSALLDQSRRQRRGSSRFFSRSPQVGISGVSWSRDGRLVLANYRGGDVVLFDVDKPAKEDSSAVFGAPATTEADGSGSSGDENQSSHSEETLQQSSLGKVHIGAVRCFTGRVNEQTCAKEVRFLSGSTAVATGGDCGNFFIWETASGDLMRKLPADRCVVNCVAPHPVLPLVCTSGIDSDIKVWDVGATRTMKEGKTSDARKRRGCPDESICSPNDWGRRRREMAPNVTSGESQRRMQEAERMKHHGNELVRQAHWSAALELYGSALQELHFQAPSAAVHEQLNRLVVSCRLNCALCHLRLEAYLAVVEECTKVLEKDARSVKAYFRRASALGETREFIRALEDVDSALVVEPGHVEVLRLRTKLQKLQRKSQKRQRDA